MVTSGTPPLAIEGVKDEYEQTSLTIRPIKIEGGNGLKKYGTVLAAHTMAPAQSTCPAVDACCKCRPTSTCTTSQCKCRKDACTCVSFQYMGQCANMAPHTRRDDHQTTQKENAEEIGTDKRERRHRRTKGWKTPMRVEGEGKRMDQADTNPHNLHKRQLAEHSDG